MRIKKYIYLIISSFILYSASAFAQWHEPKPVTEKFFPDPEIENVIPSLQTGKGFTSYNEMMVFLNRLVQTNPTSVKMEMVAKTQKGKEIPLITIKKSDDNDKLNVFYFARVHGDEPAGTEAMLYFMHKITTDASVQELLNRLNFYILPMVNIDGGESMSRRTANNIDLNRDQSKLDTPEAKILHEVVNRVKPHVSVDFHEYQPIRTDFLRIAPDKVLATPWDVMFLYSGNPNVPISLRNAVDNLYLPALGKKLDENELTHHTYYASSNSYGAIHIPIGGASPRSTSNAMALKNIISLLIETRGIRLGDTSLKRRLYGGYLSALAVAETTYKNKEEVLNVLENGINDRGDVVVRFSAERVSDYKLPFLDVLKNEIIPVTVDVRFNTRQRPTQTRPLPDAYYLLPSETEAVQILRNMGVEVTELASAEEKTVEAHTVRSAVESASEVGGVYPLTVRVNTVSKQVQLPAGTFKVDTKQDKVRAATVLLEPESSNGFVNYRVIEVETGKEIPVYRFTKI